MTREGDVGMNRGIANCSLLSNNGDFNSAVTHEVGHTLGFRHSDQTRADNPSIACTTDPSLECSNSAIMKASIATGLNGALQAWDQHAVDAVYRRLRRHDFDGSHRREARATASTQVLITWNGVFGASSNQILRRDPGIGLRQIGTSTTNSHTDNSAPANTAYLYALVAVASAGAPPRTAPPSAPPP